MIEISMEIKMSKFWSEIIASCVALGEFHFRSKRMNFGTAGACVGAGNS